MNHHLLFLKNIGVKLSVPGDIPFDNYIDGPFDLTEIYYFTSRPGVIEYDVFPNVKLVAAAIAFVLVRSAYQLFQQLAVGQLVEALL